MLFYRYYLASKQSFKGQIKKAFTLLSILGAFMVFFIVHFTKMQLDMVIFSLIMIYFPAAMGTIYFLVRVLIPRVRGAKELNDNPDEEQTEDINPTFFAGISQFNTPNEYAKYLKSIANDEKKLYKMFSAQVFSLGLINQRKIIVLESQWFSLLLR